MLKGSTIEETKLTLFLKTLTWKFLRTMSTSWAGRSTQDTEEAAPRFQNIDCRCCRRARVKISESEKNKGRLYYCCDNGVCGTFLAWANPTRGGTTIEVSSQRQKGFERVLEEVVDLRRENAINMVEVKNSINNAKNATYVMLMLVVFIILLVVMYLK